MRKVRFSVVCDYVKKVHLYVPFLFFMNTQDSRPISRLNISLSTYCPTLFVPAAALQCRIFCRCAFRHRNKNAP
jgi:hypothetical protein